MEDDKECEGEEGQILIKIKLGNSYLSNLSYDNNNYHFACSFLPSLANVSDIIDYSILTARKDRKVLLEMLFVFNEKMIKRMKRCQDIGCKFNPGQKLLFDVLYADNVNNQEICQNFQASN